MAFALVHLKSPGTKVYPTLFLCSYSRLYRTIASSVMAILIAIRMPKSVQSWMSQRVTPMIDGYEPEPLSI
jgi:hypothetical protein